MKSTVIARVLGFGLLAAGWGCSHLDVAPEGNPDRVLVGTIRTPSALPAGAEVLVRLVDDARPEMGASSAKSDLPLGDRGRPAGAGGRFLGEYRQTLVAMATEPVPFKLEYRADDSVLRHGVSLDVRISFGGRVRYRTIQAHVVTLASSPYPQFVLVQALE